MDTNGRNGHSDPLADYPLLRADRDLRMSPRSAESAEGAENTENSTSSSHVPVSLPHSGLAARQAGGPAPPRDNADEARFLTIMFEAARREKTPAVARKFVVPGMRRLVALCKVLQRAATERDEVTFCLSCRVAGDFLGINAGVAWRWVRALLRAKVILCVKPGSLVHGSKRPGSASEYRYLGD